ncbi:MAG: hypothetical protein ACE5G1_17830, partial [bacterium]
PAKHRSGLKTADGKIWGFVHTPETDDLLHNPDYLKKDAKVYGTLFTNSQFIYVKKFDLL